MEPHTETPTPYIAELDLDKFDDLFSDTDSDLSFDSDEEFTDDDDDDVSDSGEEESSSDDEDDDFECDEESDDDGDDDDFCADELHQSGSFSDMEADADNGSWAEEALENKQEEEAAPPASAAALNMAKIASLAQMADSAQAGLDLFVPAPISPPRSPESQVEKLAELAKMTAVKADEATTASPISSAAVTPSQSSNDAAPAMPTLSQDASSNNDKSTKLPISSRIVGEPTSSPVASLQNTSPTDDEDSSSSLSSKDEQHHTNKKKLLPSQKPIPAYVPTKEMDAAEVSNLLNKKRLEHFVKEQQDKGVTEKEKLKEETKNKFVVRTFSAVVRPAMDSLTGRTFRNWFMPSNTIRKTKAQRGLDDPKSLVETLRKIVSRKCKLDVTKFDYDMVAKDFFVPVSADRIAAHSTVLQRAIQAEDLDILRKFHAAGSPLNTCNKFGESVLHSAARRSLHKTLHFLIHECNVDVRVHDDYGRTPMHDCCWTTSPNLQVAKVLLEAWPDMLYICDMRGFTPLQYVRKEYYPEWTEFLKQLPKEYLKPKVLHLPKKQRSIFSWRSYGPNSPPRSPPGSPKWTESL
uniref:Uncharacterized protein n=1 Tax=Grammatophora oceanica TaxID=210454 RepID=A0A7S1VHP3_9STRA|mmetsp:Transcript_45456/g.67523  ORF Transcript_45456/g.67523 Transcript_45456/m.67523 type:complete len:578 (+) Transcript_45456:222-1955(+)|eukprot:CAMPEP_0194047250 /NCGR_PEP_ID=MMETSP0009_2-20130614/23649_1 /TAXON_ID=210454 /ORGANISM="Grammatophora oceanica, Strain CCMP 410" /LENGTH=577 /DNA_ID=CAMNT_0038692801 /DNA_START=163 /DNA_END=1896 /DNA_ORIENTATION=+